MIVDAHIHYYGDAPEALALLAAIDAKLLNVAVTETPGDGWRDAAGVARDLAAHYPERYGWCTTFDLPDATAWATPQDRRQYVDGVIAGLDRDFAAGAIGCKVWKSIGMQLRKPSGEFVMVDDPLFGPIYEHLASSGRSLLMHVGEPLACWQPLDGANAHAGYYSQHPEWHMGDKPDHPSHRALTVARDAVVERHPGLRVIGAHLGSLEYDLSEVAARLERYPNFAVDTSARLQDLVRHDRAQVRSLFMGFPDRILYGTDVVSLSAVSSLEEAERAAHLESMAGRYARELAYYRTDGWMTLHGVETQGLGLPQDIVVAVLGDNARRWYPGL